MSNLNDLDHVWGNDLSAAANGDLLLSSGSAQTEQRILRRLMTNPGTSAKAADYIFQPEYGAGIPSFVGTTASVGQIQSTTKGQVSMEKAVASQPPPTVSASMSNGTLTETITYADATTGQTGVLSFNVTPESE
jgi:hypothetical protein